MQDMIFVGIIEANRDIVYDIMQFFLGFENYSLLFICSSFEEYKSLAPVKRTKADIILMDSGHHNFDRFWQLKYLKRVNQKMHIVLLSEDTINESVISKSKKEGIDSVVNKKNVTQDLAQFFGNGSNAKNNGNDYHITDGDAVQVLQNGNKISLTTREFEIVELVVKGYANKKIGELLFISPYTVNAHLRKIYIKLSVNSRTALINHIINEFVQSMDTAD